MSNGNDNETAETIHNAGKVQLADTLRLMGDNQRTLNATNAADRRRRELDARVEERMAHERVDNLGGSQPLVGEEEMRINVDSPTTTTVNHYYPPDVAADPDPSPRLIPQPETRPKPSAGVLVKAAIAAGLIVSGAGLGAAVPWALGMFNRPPPPVEAPVDTVTQIEIE